jgi:hypothetical protein
VAAVARLYRPHIPLEVRYRVVLRQLGYMWPDEVIYIWRRGTSWRQRLVFERRLGELAELLGCTRKELRLDHDPALGARLRTGEGKNMVYTPAANDPEHLFYLTAHDHHLKTNVRGGGAQYPDRVLIKRERDRLKKKKRPKHKWGSRPLRSASRWPSKGGRKLGG